MIPLARPYFGAEEEQAVAEVLRSGWVAQGPTTEKFETAFAQATGTRHAIATSSCTTALHLAIVGAGIGPGDEVILPSFTFPATANAVLYEGATPVLVDIDPTTLNVDADCAAAAITDKTRAIIGVHLFGLPCPVGRLRDLTRGKSITLIEDAACAIGSRVAGQPVGSFGDVACFSLHARKVVTCGEGGVLTTNDDDLAERMRSLRTHGVDRAAETRHQEGAAPADATYSRVGYNYRLSDIHSAVAQVQLQRLPSFVEKRAQLAQRYNEGLRDLVHLRLPPVGTTSDVAWQSYVVVVEAGAPISPRALMDGLAAAGIGTRIGTYAVHQQPYFVELHGQQSLPHAAEAAQRSIALPLFHTLTTEDCDLVIAKIRDCWQPDSR